MKFKSYWPLLLASLSFSLLHADDCCDTDCAEETNTCCAQEQCRQRYNENDDLYDSGCWQHVACNTDCEWARENNLWGIWFPEAPPLFRPFVADPRQVTYSGGWRFNDRVIDQNVIPVSFGDIFPIFRWCDMFCVHGDLEIELEGGVWAIFDPLKNSSPLIDADYYVGIPLVFAFDNWAFRLRGYHISTHLGDEFLITHPHFYRRNPSIEAFDFDVSNQFSKELRLYAGLGWLAAQDDSYRLGRFYCLAGFEIRFPQFGYRDYCDRLYGEPFMGVHLYYQSHFKNHINNTYVLGYEWGKVSGLRRRLRFFLEYHDGYSLDGQFSIFPTHYFSIKASYGY